MRVRERERTNKKCIYIYTHKNCGGGTVRWEGIEEDEERKDGGRLEVCNGVRLNHKLNLGFPNLPASCHNFLHQ